MDGHCSNKIQPHRFQNSSKVFHNFLMPAHILWKVQFIWARPRLVSYLCANVYAVNICFVYWFYWSADKLVYLTGCV